MTAAALLLLAVAVTLGGGRPGSVRLHRTDRSPAPSGPEPVVRTGWVVVAGAAVGALGWAVGGPVVGVTGGLLAAGAGFLAGRAGRQGDDRTSSAALAAAWELLDVCLRAGMPVADAVTAAAAPVQGSAGAALRRVAGLLELGAPAAEAWQRTTDVPELGAVARAAGRSAGTGAALAQVAAAECTRLRAELVDTAQARAQRAAVLITGPLGLCFLPAFLLLGIAPVVIGLAGDVLTRW